MFLQYLWVQLCLFLPPRSARHFCQPLSSRLRGRAQGLGWGQAGAGVAHQHCPGQSKGRQKAPEPRFQGQGTVQNISLISDPFFSLRGAVGCHGLHGTSPIIYNLLSRRLVSKIVRNKGLLLLVCLTSGQPSPSGFATFGQVWGFCFFKALPLLSDTVTALVWLK